jgi:hypothetical protein
MDCLYLGECGGGMSFNLRYVVYERMKESNLTCKDIGKKTKWKSKRIKKAIEGNYDVSTYNMLCDFFNLDKQLYKTYLR